MNRKSLRELSKEISYALRHRPDEYGLTLDREGFVEVSALLSALNARRHGQPAATAADLHDILATFDKQRFEIAGTRIRALYGHSVGQDIEMREAVPHGVLYHGTSREAWQKIDKQGLRPMNRKYVHLSQDVDTAVRVGSRHDRHPVVLAVDADAMHENGHVFFCANDKTWTTKYVPRRFVSLMD